jgi:hypothetical protein
MDVTGNGVVDLMVKEGSSLGYYGRDDAGWTSFRPFLFAPLLNLEDPNLRMVDLTGDGFADMFITEDSVFTFYASMGEMGFSAAEQILSNLSENQGPRILFSDPEATIALARFSGSGLADLVRIRNRDICYWPSMGWGRFGKKVTMDNAPQFDNNYSFNQKNVHIADIDGSGFEDILYTGSRGAVAYFNHAGNSWDSGQIIAQYPATDSVTSTAVTDLFGRGTACLIWSSPLAYAQQSSLKFIDLSGGQKPHLLTGIVSNYGSETTIHYEPSTMFYLQDMEEGTPWITTLPFPVSCVERVAVVDYVSQTTFTARYRYHHGY